MKNHKNQPGIMKNPENRPRTMKNKPGTMKNHKNQPGTMKIQPGTMKNHEKQPGTMKNQPGEKVLIFCYQRGVTTDLQNLQGMVGEDMDKVGKK